MTRPEPILLLLVALGAVPTVVAGNLLSLPLVLFLALSPVVVVSALRLHGELRLLAVACVLASLVAAASNARVSADLSRVLLGNWQPVLILLACCGFLWVIRESGYTTLTIIRVALAADVVFGLTTASAATPAELWKFGVGVPLTLLACSYLHRLTAWPAAALLLVLSVGNLLLGFRALFASCFLAAVILPVLPWLPRKRLASLIVFGSVGLVGAVCVILLYPAAASSGLLGSGQQEKYRSQSGASLGFVIAARPEIFASLVAVRGEPWLGRGTVPVLDTVERAETLKLAARYGAPYNENDARRIFAERLNSHSLLLGTAVTAGLLATLPWLLILALLVQGYARARGPSAVGVNAVLLAGSSLYAWDMLFSPWSPHLELRLGLLLAVGLTQSRTGRVRADR